MQRARDAFAAALEEDPGDPEALDGPGQSLWSVGSTRRPTKPQARSLAARGEVGITVVSMTSTLARVDPSCVGCRPYLHPLSTAMAPPVFGSPRTEALPS
jgi:hypothetical protein